MSETKHPYRTIDGKGEDCGCEPDGVYINLCPLHKAAPELLEACEDLVSWAGKDKRRLLKQRKITNVQYVEMFIASLNKACAAIKRAKGE